MPDMPEEKPATMSPTPATSQEKEVWEQLETAQQQVRPVIKREVEGEPVSKELLNLRLKLPG
jgi:hypothetical protein